MSKFKLTLTCEADSAEALLKALELYKKDFARLAGALEHMAETREVVGPYSDIGPLAGKLGQMRYTVESPGQKAADVPAEVRHPFSARLMSPGLVVPAYSQQIAEMAKADCARVLPQAFPPDDRPEGCQADGAGGNCGGVDGCDKSGPCATKQEPTGG